MIGKDRFTVMVIYISLIRLFTVEAVVVVVEAAKKYLHIKNNNNKITLREHTRTEKVKKIIKKKNSENIVHY